MPINCPGVALISNFQDAVPSAFVIAGSSYVAALRKQLCDDPTVTVFSETESLDALRLILSRPPKMLALDSAIVRTARGALLVSQLKEAGGMDVRVLTEDESSLPLLLAQPDIGLHAGSRPLDGCGTRVAKRFPMNPEAGVVIDGERSRLVNLSTSGAQIIVPARIQPGQNVRLTLIDEAAETRLQASVAWSTVEIGQSAVRYRAGVAFVNPAVSVLEAFCRRHEVSS